mgnify:CR=1 FL=1
MKYNEEQVKRRKLFNQVQEAKGALKLYFMRLLYGITIKISYQNAFLFLISQSICKFATGNIRVFCRCRPLSKSEALAGCSIVVDFDAAKDGELGILNAGSMKKTFKFDRVYTPKDDQGVYFYSRLLDNISVVYNLKYANLVYVLLTVDVFADASPMVTSVLDGYNVCIFAYGQTGTGKTFTMEGTVEKRGVNYRTLEELFKIAKERSENFTYKISVSVLEVYNEQIRDLLDASSASKK